MLPRGVCKDLWRLILWDSQAARFEAKGSLSVYGEKNQQEQNVPDPDSRCGSTDLAQAPAFASVRSDVVRPHDEDQRKFPVAEVQVILHFLAWHMNDLNHHTSWGLIQQLVPLLANRI